MSRLVLLLLLLANSIVYGAADLEIRSLSATPDSNRIQLTVDFVNHGPNSAANLGCNVYVYARQRLLLSQSFALLPLAPGHERQEALHIELPSDSATAVKAEVYDSVEPDTQPSTNFVQANIKPPDYKRSDLAIEDSNIETVQPLVDKALVDLKLRNNGPDPLPYSKLTVNLVVFDNVVASSERRMARMASGEEAELKMPLPIAASYRSAEGRLEVKFASPDPDVVDPVPNNNQIAIPVQLTPRLPDLVPQNIRIDKHGVLSFEVLNKGNVRSPLSVTALYINGALVQRYNTPELPPNSPQKNQYTGSKISADATITVVCDFNADVEEFSEENNRKANH